GPGRRGRKPTPSALHAHDLAERVHDLDEVRLRRHHGVDRLVRHGGLVEDAGVLPTLDAGRRRDVLRYGEAALRFRPGHGAPCPVAAALEALRVALAADDVRLRAHAPRDDPELAASGPHRALPGDEDALTEVALARDVVVVAVHGLLPRVERR